MKKILTIIGARPQIIKAAAISRAIKNSFSEELVEVIVHTGQHYDENMSEVFFEELQIPRPNYNMNIGSGKHGQQTAKMIEGIEKILLDEKPDVLLIYGDTNSTLAGSVAASKIHVPIAHIEAGLRSFNKSMPEEINRVLSDHVSSMLFCPTKEALVNLENEGFSLKIKIDEASAEKPFVGLSGDIMLDNTLHFSTMAESSYSFLNQIGVEQNNFILATCHRPSNTDHLENINSIFSSLLQIGEENELTIVLPIHPRTNKMFEQYVEESTKDKIKNSNYFKIIEPVSFLEMVLLEANCKMVVTDSGGVQKEAFFLEKPCLVMREETEWVELVENGNAILTGPDSNKILNGYATFQNKSLTYPEFYGNGRASENICQAIIDFLNS